MQKFSKKAQNLKISKRPKVYKSKKCKIYKLQKKRKFSENSKIKISSNRSFGLVFFTVFFIVSLWPLIQDNQIRIWALIISFVFLFLGLINSNLLSPLNKIWFKFGILLGAIIAPIVMAFIFFAVVTPIALFVRIIGKDLLRQKYKKNNKSYWIKKDKDVNTMKEQF